MSCRSPVRPRGPGTKFSTCGVLFVIHFGSFGFLGFTLLKFKSLTVVEVENFAFCVGRPSKSVFGVSIDVLGWSRKICVPHKASCKIGIWVSERESKSLRFAQGVLQNIDLGFYLMCLGFVEKCVFCPGEPAKTKL